MAKVHVNEGGLPPYEARMFINGEEVDTQDRVSIVNPANTEEVVGTMPKGTVEHAHRAVEAAHKAFPAWSAMTMKERAAAVAQAVRALLPQMEERAILMTRENGKTLGESRFDVSAAPRITDYYEQLVPDFPLEMELPSPKGRVLLLRQPMGVASVVVPWNAPVLLGFLGIAPALMAGNTVVAKPSTFCPLAFMDTIRVMAPHLPPGVLNAVIGSGGTIGKELVTHPLVRRVLFTGSVEVGKQIMQDAAATLKRCTMELGGNDPAIVLDDVNLDTAIPGLVRASYACAGQICYDIKRIYVQRAIYDKFVQRFTEAVDQWHVGYGLDPQVQMGSLTTKSQFQFVNELLDQLRSSNAKTVQLGKKVIDDNQWGRGLFIAPHVVTEVDYNAPIVTCEQFGPVVPILPFDTEDEAVRLANDTEFGLASSVWTSDEDRGWKVARRIQAGSTFINAHAGASGVDMPFGGFKWSGVGRSHGIVALEEQFELQTVSTRQP